MECQYSLILSCDGGNSYELFLEREICFSPRKGMSVDLESLADRHIVEYICWVESEGFMEIELDEVAYDTEAEVQEEIEIMKRFGWHHFQTA